VLTRSAAAGVLRAVTCAPITRTVRHIASEVEVGPECGLPETGVINCDSLLTVPKQRLDPAPVGVLGVEQRIELDRALRFALDIVY
jgi:mRNA-degrading endonuclease toxin of MazEF toxin-antitoxin module